MRTRRYTQGITFFTTPQMYLDVKAASDDLEVSLSELFRDMIAWYLKTHPVNWQQAGESDLKIKGKGSRINGKM